MAIVLDAQFYNILYGTERKIEGAKALFFRNKILLYNERN